MPSPYPLPRAGEGKDQKRKKESADKPGSVVSSHSSRPCVAARLEQPTRERRGPRHYSPIWSCSRWGLPCHAALAPRAVRSYRTFSPLPRTSRDAVRRFAFCCTFRRLTPPRRYLAPCPMEPGLSSAQQVRRGCLADSVVSLTRRACRRGAAFGRDAQHCCNAHLNVGVRRRPRRHADAHRRLATPDRNAAPAGAILLQR